MSELATPFTACGRCHSLLEPGDLRCPICAQVIPSSSHEPVPEARAAILRCDGCGAAVAYDVTVQAPRCAFCTSVMHVERPEDPPEVAEAEVPFSVQPAQAKAALGRWLGRKRYFRPPDLASASSLESLRPLLWPAWILDARAQVSWAVDSDAGARRARWAPHAGQTPMSFERVLVSASRGLTMQECAQLAPHFDLSRAVAGAARPEGTVEERFDVQRSSARRHVAQVLEGGAVAQLHQRGALPGSRHRNLHVAVLLEGLVTRRLALPTYVLAYRYDGRVFRALVHGQHAEVVLGEMPWSKLRIAAAIAAGLLLLAGLIALLGMR